MNKEKMLGYVEVAGLSIVLLSAVVWLFNHGVAGVLIAVGTVLLALGRLLQTPFYAKYSAADPRELTLRRLYHQRVFGIIALVLSAALMNMPMGFYFGVWLAPSSWLVLFVFFVVVEVYTVFRISAVDKEQKQ